MADEMQTIQDFIAAHSITITSVRADSNPNMPDENDRPPMDHWTVTLRHPGQNLTGRKNPAAVRMTLIYSKGFGHNGAEPDAMEVLDCLASDASGIENAAGNFTEWCSEYGYDSDSRKAEKTFKACQRLTNKLHTFLGDDAFNSLLWETERY